MKVSLNFSKSIAHRSHSGENLPPENTLKALELAHARGYQWVECDVHLSNDGIIFLLHDDTLARTTTAPEPSASTDVQYLNYAEIAAYDAGVKFGQEYVGEKVPTLREFLAMLQSYNMGLLLELKPSAGKEIETTEKTIELLREMNLLNYPKLLVQSFYIECLRTARNLAPELNLGLIVAWWAINTQREAKHAVHLTESITQANIEEILKELKCQALVAHYGILTPNLIEKIKALAISILAWTVNDPETAKTLLQNGVDAVITDHPERMTNVLNPSPKSCAFFTNLKHTLVNSERLDVNRLAL